MNELIDFLIDNENISSFMFDKQVSVLEVLGIDDFIRTYEFSLKCDVINNNTLKLIIQDFLNLEKEI